MEQHIARRLWAALQGPDEVLGALRFDGPVGGLPSRFHVSPFAAATIGVATLAAAELWAHRRGSAPAGVRIERQLASAAFVCERLTALVGWEVPSPWDAVAGDYEASDGWIRLHTNYGHHREAALSVLGVPAERERVAAALKSHRAVEVEQAVVDAGGCAAALRTIDAWRAHAQGMALAGEPLVVWESGDARTLPSCRQGGPLAGIRVLDLTRVIAGPVGTRHLAAFGADVLRIDPPGFEEMPSLLLETTRGKRRTALDLRTADGRIRFERLVADADVMVHGYRPDALARLGYTVERLRMLNPSLVLVALDAYGWSGPWAGRRGFDSLVQMSSGIAHPGHAGKPTPLPAQALDHGTGYLIAAAVCRALVAGRSGARLALARTALELVRLGEDGDPAGPGLIDAEHHLESSASDFGPLRQVRCAGHIDGFAVAWPHAPGRLGVDEARWTERPGHEQSARG